MKSYSALVLVALVFFLVGTCASVPAKECTDGQTKREDCNNCFCGNGKWACTYKACLKKRDVSQEICSDGQTKYENCNKCSCSNGLWKCTERACVSKREAAPLEQCNNGEIKYENCNRCSCRNGLWKCTQRACVSKREAQNNEPECKKGETKTEGCNNCKCTENGLFACTKKFCLDKREAIPTKFDATIQKRDAFSCSPGQSFEKECNTCVCTQDGKNAICSLKRCLPTDTSHV